MRDEVTDAPATPRRPNIYQFLADDLGYNDLTKRRAPHLDALRKSGVSLGNLYTFKTCGPSRAAILTGRYPFHMGIYSNADIQSYGVPTNFTFLPALLKQLGGYSTHAMCVHPTWTCTCLQVLHTFSVDVCGACLTSASHALLFRSGKWHVGFRSEGQTPTRRGFDTFFGFWRCCSDYYKHGFVEDGGATDQTNATAAGGLVADHGHQGEYSTFLYAREAVRIIRDHRLRATPLYLYLAFQAVHGPYQAPEHYLRMYANVSHYDSRAYLAMITAMDDAVSMVLRAAKHSNLWEGSLVLFCSDNGARLGDATGSNHPFRGGKFTLWEGGTRIVAFLSGPLMAARHDTHWSGLAHTSDFLPTLLSAAGLTLPHDTGPTPLDGVDLWEAIRHDRASPRREVVHNLLNRWNHRDCRGSDLDEENCGAAIRVGKYKLVAGYPGDSRWSNHTPPNDGHWTNRGRRFVPRGPQMPWDFQTLGAAAWHAPRMDGCNLFTGHGCPCWRRHCLFDLESDPGETTDLGKRLPHVVRRLLARLADAGTTGTQGAHLCRAATEVDDRAFAAVRSAHRALLPYANASSSIWRDDRAARSCYTPCPLRVENEHLATGVHLGLPPAWCEKSDAARPAVSARDSVGR